MQVLVWVIVPPPHVTLQELHPDQALQPPLIALKECHQKVNKMQVIDEAKNAQTLLGEK